MKPQRIFISYDVADQKIAQAIAATLKEHLQAPWMDRDSLLGGLTWEDTIIKVIDQETDFFLMLLSRASLQNDRFFKREYELALKRLEKAQGDFVIVPLCIEDINLGVSDLPPEIKKLHAIRLAEDMNLENVFLALGLETLRDTHHFVEGHWVGYSIEDVSMLGGDSNEVFPCYAKLQIKHNIVRGIVTVDYKGIGDTHKVTLEVFGYPIKNTVVFEWKNRDNSLQKGTTILNVISDNLLAGYFTAVGVDSDEAQQGNTAFHKVNMDVYKAGRLGLPSGH